MILDRIVFEIKDRAKMENEIQKQIKEFYNYIDFPLTCPIIVIIRFYANKKVDLPKKNINFEGILWKKDHQVIALHKYKQYSEKPRIEVEIRETDY